MGVREGFENFVIDELGPYALTGGAMSIYEAVKKAWQAATLQAAERMKEEAALQGWMSASGDCEDRVRAAIRAIDVNKLFGE